LYSNQLIKRFTAGLMLLLFALSVTPKQLLHYAITGHKHNYAKSGEPVNFKASKNNFQCNWDEQVVESPFTDEPDFQLPQPPTFFSSHINHYILSTYSAELFFSALRGPPILV
jgi:hypothetical protein